MKTDINVCCFKENNCIYSLSNKSREDKDYSRQRPINDHPSYLVFKKLFWEMIIRYMYVYGGKQTRDCDSSGLVCVVTRGRHVESPLCSGAAFLFMECDPGSMSMEI